MPANGSGRVEAVPRAVRPVRASYRFEDTYGRRSVGPSTGVAQAVGATPAHLRRPVHGTPHRVGGELVEPRFTSDRGAALELASRATSASRHSDAVAFKYYNNRRTSVTAGSHDGGGGVVVGAPSARQAGRAQNGKSSHDGGGLSQRRLRRHEQLMLYKADAVPSQAGRQIMLIDDSDEDETAGQPLDIVDRLQQDERQVCELLVCMLLHKPPIAAQSILSALTQRVEARRMLRHYAGLRGSPVANTEEHTPKSKNQHHVKDDDDEARLEAMSVADRAALISTLEARQRQWQGVAAKEGGDEAGADAARERRRREWVQRQTGYKGPPPRVPTRGVAAGQKARAPGEPPARKTPAQSTAPTSAVAAAIAVRALRATRHPLPASALPDDNDDVSRAATTANTPYSNTPASYEPRVSSATPQPDHKTTLTSTHALARRRNGAGPPPLSRASLAAAATAATGPCLSEEEEQQYEKLPSMHELLPRLDERQLSPGAAAARRAYLESHPQRNLSGGPQNRLPTQKSVTPVVRKVLPNLLESSTCSLDEAAEPGGTVKSSSHISANESQASNPDDDDDDDVMEDVVKPTLSGDDVALVQSKDASVLSVNSSAPPPRLNVTAAPRRIAQLRMADEQPRRGVGATAVHGLPSLDAGHEARNENSVQSSSHTVAVSRDNHDGHATVPDQAPAVVADECGPSLPSGPRPPPSMLLAPTAPCPKETEATGAAPQTMPRDTIASVMTGISTVNETTTTVDGDGGATVVVTTSQLSPIEVTAVTPSQNSALRSDDGDTFKLPWED